MHCSRMFSKAASKRQLLISYLIKEYVPFPLMLVGIIDPDALKALPIAMVSRQEFEGNFFFIIAISLLRIEPGHCIIGCEI